MCRIWELHSKCDCSQIGPCKGVYGCHDDMPPALHNQKLFLCFLCVQAVRLPEPHLVGRSCDDASARCGCEDAVLDGDHEADTFSSRGYPFESSSASTTNVDVARKVVCSEGHTWRSDLNFGSHSMEVSAEFIRARTGGQEGLILGTRLTRYLECESFSHCT